MNTEIVIGEVVLCVLGLYGFYSLNRLILSNKILAETAKLKSMIAKFRQDFADMERSPGEFTADALGDLGIPGLLSSLNITPEMLKSLGLPGWVTPIINGFLSKAKQKGGGDDVAQEETKQPRFRGQAD